MNILVDIVLVVVVIMSIVVIEATLSYDPSWKKDLLGIPIVNVIFIILAGVAAIPVVIWKILKRMWVVVFLTRERIR